MSFRYAICNETFEGWGFGKVCQTAAQLGYQGLEIAPFTVADRIENLSAQARHRLLRQAEEHGLQIIGLHWLLAKTEGFYLTSPDAAVRKRTADYLSELARFCRDVGGSLMVFGSPDQRRVPIGSTAEQATAWAADTFRQAAHAFADAGVVLCLEPLGPCETDFITTIDQANELIHQIDRPNFALHLDVKAMCTETTSAADLVRRHGSSAGHFHANDANRRGPGFGATDFVPIFRALQGSGYGGWVSVEVFDTQPDSVTVARESIRYMREAELQGV